MYLRGRVVHGGKYLISCSTRHLHLYFDYLFAETISAGCKLSVNHRIPVLDYAGAGAVDAAKSGLSPILALSSLPPAAGIAARNNAAKEPEPLTDIPPIPAKCHLLRLLCKQ
jgi:hypothetical protein